MCVVNETIRSHSDAQSMQDSYLKLNIHRHQSISHFDLIVLTYFCFINPKFGKFHDIPRYTVNSIFITGFRDSVCVFRIMEIIGPYVIKAEFSASLRQSSVSHDPSEIIIIFAAQETFLIIIKYKKKTVVLLRIFVETVIHYTHMIHVIHIYNTIVFYIYTRSFGSLQTFV